MGCPDLFGQCIEGRTQHVREDVRRRRDDALCDHAKIRHRSFRLCQGYHLEGGARTDRQIGAAQQRAGCHGRDEGSVALFGQKGMRQNDPDFFAATILNQVLGGGGFESRLMDEVREKRGLTYGVYSYLLPRDLAETYMGSVSSANDRIGQAIQVIRDEWAKAATEGITQKELEDAKTFITGSYPLRFDGNAPIASILVGMQLIGLPIDYIATRNDKVEAVTLEDVKRVAGELLTPDDLLFVVVGQPDGVETTLSEPVAE